MNKDMYELEKAIGGRVRAMREASAMSQADLSAAMRQRGVRWAQATVWAVEAGERPLRLSETTLLAEIFGCAQSAFLTEESRVDGAEPGLKLALRAIEGLLASRS